MLKLSELNYRKIRLESERLVLKEVPMEQRNRFFEIFSDREVLRYTDREITHTIDEAILYLKNCQLRAEKKQHFFLGLFRKSDNKLLGILSLYHIDVKHSFASLGILLAKEYWRMGYMSEAMLRFLKFYFIELGFHRIEAQTFVDNLPAVKFFEKLKFSNEGILRENFMIEGKYENSYLFSMLDADYLCHYKP
jgi:ribosomal-protein-alanine N-acetyltransferase